MSKVRASDEASNASAMRMSNEGTARRANRPIRGPRTDAEVAHRAGLPTRGQVRGVITVIQEHRFRLEDEQGRGYLFTLGRAAAASMRDLFMWSGQKIPVTVEYDGPPDLGAVAVSVRR